MSNDKFTYRREHNRNKPKGGRTRVGGHKMRLKARKGETFLESRLRIKKAQKSASLLSERLDYDMEILGKITKSLQPNDINVTELNQEISKALDKASLLENRLVTSTSEDYLLVQNKDGSTTIVNFEEFETLGYMPSNIINSSSSPLSLQKQWIANSKNVPSHIQKLPVKKYESFVKKEMKLLDKKLEKQLEIEISLPSKYDKKTTLIIEPRKGNIFSPEARKVLTGLINKDTTEQRYRDRGFVEQFKLRNDEILPVLVKLDKLPKKNR